MIKFKEIPVDERPRERLMLYGAEHLSNEELLMILLKTGTKKKSVKELAVEVLAKSGGIENLRNISFHQLLEIEGIGQIKAIELIAMIEFMKRMNASVSEREIISFKNPSTIIRYFDDLFYCVKQEEFYCIYLDNKKNYLSRKKLFVGTINLSVVHPREIFKEAYLLSASFMICIHNHPSGDPTPSKEDIVLTENLKKLGEIHGIYLVDHLIIGNHCYYSFYEDHHILNNNL